MKLRTFITFMFVSFAVISVSAQKAQHFEVGVQGGFGSHWIINQNNYGMQEMDYEYTWGGGFNFQAGYNFNENIGVFAEVGVLKQGQDYKDDSFMQQDIEVKRTVDMQYLNVPVFFKYSAGNTKAHFRLLVGPQFGFLQKAEQEYLVNDVNIEGEFELTNKEGKKFDPAAKDLKERYNSMDISAVLDLGADIFVVDNILYLSTGARMFYGLTDINATEYQMENYDGNYEPSHHAGGTLYFGVHYIIAGK